MHQHVAGGRSVGFRCAALALAISAAGCGGVRFAGVNGGDADETITRGPVATRPDPSRTGERVPGRTAGSPAMSRRVCRSAAKPAGWIAVDYLRLGSQCPLKGEADMAAINGAVIVRHADQPTGAEMYICADQVVPAGWEELRFQERDTAAGKCEGAAREGDSPVRLIRRFR